MYQIMFLFITTSYGGNTQFLPLLNEKMFYPYNGTSVVICVKYRYVDLIDIQYYLLHNKNIYICRLHTSSWIRDYSFNNKNFKNLRYKISFFENRSPTIVLYYRRGSMCHVRLHLSCKAHFVLNCLCICKSSVCSSSTGAVSRIRGRSSAAPRVLTMVFSLWATASVSTYLYLNSQPVEYLIKFKLFTLTCHALAMNQPPYFASLLHI